MAARGSWELLRQIENIIIHYDWDKYGISASEAYPMWRECYQIAKKHQLEELGVESLGNLTTDKYNDYEKAMKHRITTAIKSYLNGYIRDKLPKEVYSDLSCLLLM